MPIPSNDNSRRWNYAFLCFVLILAASGYTGRTLAQESAPSGKIYNNTFHYLLTFRDGKIATVKEYFDTYHAAEVFS